MDKIYLKRWEELTRTLNRLKGFYSGEKDKQDSLQGPKDFALNFFRVCYELKEALKNEKINGFSGRSGLVENFINTNSDIALGIDIANKNKHVNLFGSRSMARIGDFVNGHLYVSLPSGRSRIELTIDIDGKKVDCLALAERNYIIWKSFLTKHRLI